MHLTSGTLYGTENEKMRKARNISPYGSGRSKSESPARHSDALNSFTIGHSSIAEPIIKGHCWTQILTSESTAQHRKGPGNGGLAAARCTLSHDITPTMLPTNRPIPDYLRPDAAGSRKATDEEDEDRMSDDDRQKRDEDGGKRRSSRGSSPMQKSLQSSPPRASVRGSSGKGSESSHNGGTMIGDGSKGIHNTKKLNTTGTTTPPGLPGHTTQSRHKHENNDNDSAGSINDLPRAMTPNGGTQFYRMSGHVTPAAGASRETSADKRGHNEVIKELQAQAQKVTVTAVTEKLAMQHEHQQQMKFQTDENNRLTILARDSMVMYHQYEAQCHLLEENATHQLEELSQLRNEESKLLNQESYYAFQASISTDELTTMRNEGMTYSSRMNEEINHVREEMRAEFGTFQIEKAANVKNIQNLENEYLRREEEYESTTQSMHDEANLNREATEMITRMNEEVDQQKLAHTEALEEQAAEYDQKLKTANEQAMEDAKYAASNAKEDRLTLKQALESRLDDEREKTTSATMAVIDAEEKLENEIRMRGMKGDERQKCYREEINSLKVDVNRKTSEYEASKASSQRQIAEVRGLLVTAEAETSRTVEELNDARTNGASDSKHSSTQYEELHRTMEAMKKDYKDQIDQTDLVGSKLKRRLKRSEEKEAAIKLQHAKVQQELIDEFDKRLLKNNATKDQEIGVLEAKMISVTRDRHAASKDAESYQRRLKEAEAKLTNERRKSQDETEKGPHSHETSRGEKEQARKLREALEEKTEDHEIVKERLSSITAELYNTRKNFKEHCKNASEKKKRISKHNIKKARRSIDLRLDE